MKKTSLKDFKKPCWQKNVNESTKKGLDDYSTAVTYILKKTSGKETGGQKSPANRVKILVVKILLDQS